MNASRPFVRKVETAGAAAVVLLFLVTYRFPFAPDLVRFALGVVALLFVPGYLAGRLLWAPSRLSLLQWIALSFSLSLGIGCLIAWVVYLTGWDAGLILWGVCGLSIVFLAVRLAGVEGVPPTSPLRAPNADREQRWTLVAALLGVSVSVLMLLSPLGTSYREDTLGHVAVTKKILDSGDVIPEHQFYPGQEHAGQDPRVGLFHAVVASLGQGADVEMYEVWSWLRVVVAFVWVVSFFVFARVVFPDSRKAFLAALLFVLLYGGQGHYVNILKTAVYPSRVGMCLFWTGMHFVFEYGRRGGRDAFSISVALLAFSALIHATPFLNFWISLGALSVFLVLFGEGKRTFALRGARVLALGTALAVPYLLIRYLTSGDVLNPVHQAPQKVMYLPGGWFIPLPILFLEWYTFAGLLAIPLTFWTVSLARRDEGIMLLVGSTVAGLVLLLVPPLFALAYHFVNFLAVRFMILIPHVLVLTFFLSAALARLREGRWRAVKGLAFIGLVACLCYPAIFGRVEYYLDRFVGRENVSEDPELLREVFEVLEREAPEPAVVLSDPLTSYAALAFTHHFVAGLPVIHSSPRDSLSVTRILDARLALHPTTPIHEAVRLMRRYRVGYVLLNHTFRRTYRDYAYVIHPDEFEAQRKRFEEHPEIFEAVVSRGDIHLYRIQPEVLGVERPAAEGDRAELRASCPELPAPAGPTLFDGQFELVGASVLDESVARGGEVRVVCCWKRVAGGADCDYLIHVRFDREYPKGRLWREAYSKPYRKILEAIRNERYRARVIRATAEMRPPPARWPLGGAVIDSFTVRVRPDVAPGSYDVKVSLNRKPILNEIDLRDYFSDRDRYDGPTIGSIDVR